MYSRSQQRGGLPLVSIPWAVNTGGTSSAASGSGTLVVCYSPQNAHEDRMPSWCGKWFVRRLRVRGRSLSDTTSSGAPGGYHLVPQWPASCGTAMADPGHSHPRPPPYQHSFPPRRSRPCAHRLVRGRGLGRVMTPRPQPATAIRRFPSRPLRSWVPSPPQNDRGSRPSRRVRRRGLSTHLLSGPTEKRPLWFGHNAFSLLRRCLLVVH
jgi:hypothetical protein